ncbi:MAG: hypothetical protein K0R54_4140 [Clostridiaceae bacterium]|jgi:hypothetical protein|nr:hypothetical protein [Clostridiaceae bacterium]
MKTLRIAALSILYFIGTIILAVVIALAALFTYFHLQIFLFARGDYLLFVSSELNMIPVIMIMVLIIYALFSIKERYLKKNEKHIGITIEEENPVDIETLSKLERFLFKLLNKLIALDEEIAKIFRMIKICYIPVLLAAVYCGMTSYAILYKESIRLGSPIAPLGVNYKNSDIKMVNVGVAKAYKNSYSPYYQVVFNDGRYVNLFGGSMHEDKDIGFEYILIDLDKNLRAQGVIKNVDKENFEEYSKGLDKGFVSRVEKLFDNK